MGGPPGPTDDLDEGMPSPKRLKMLKPVVPRPMAPPNWNAIQMQQAQLQPAHMHHMHHMAPHGMHMGVPRMGVMPMSRAPQGIAGMRNAGF